MYYEKSENCYRFRLIFLPTFNLFDPIWILLVFDYPVESCKSFAPCCQIKRVTEEAQVAETAVWTISFLSYICTAFKGSKFYFCSPDPEGL